MLSRYSCFGILMMAGTGSRYSKETPKQYTLYEGKPLFLHAYEAMANSPLIDAIICVIGENQEGIAKNLLSMFNSAKPTYFVIGGDSREDSVSNAISYLGEHWAKDDSLLLIQDAARPRLEESYIEEGLAKAKKCGASVTCYPSSDSVALGNGKKLTSYLDRREVYIIATPQCFRYSIIKEAFDKRDPEKQYTDDASIVLDVLGIKPAIVLGKRDNIKITFPTDAR